LPSAPQVPPKARGAVVIVVAAPPPTGARRSLPLAKKAMKRPSGEKNGQVASDPESTARAVKT